ncbi:zinc finger protein 182-like isoform X2 [Nerophis ophidion]|uniref:zinc finger protein 182-like isoform X2 n=1 Tax=Nerophis ophidion TaxID=159077 RepID=UPI002ADFCA8A|nr:zinc finger protein 182-like isoform X2 [Nerophis ophidion]
MTLPPSYGPTRKVGRRGKSLCFDGDEKNYESWETKFVEHLGQLGLKAALLSEPQDNKDDVQKNEDVYAELIQVLDDKSLSLIMIEAEDDGRRALKILRDYYAESQEEIPSEMQELNSSGRQKEPVPCSFKAEEEEWWGPLRGSGEANDDEAQSSQLHPSQSEENRGAELQTRHTTKADGEYCEDVDSEPDDIFAPLSDIDGMSDSSESDQGDTKKPLKSSKNSKSDTKHNINNKRYDCSECGKICTQKCHFIIHMRSHTGEKPFACSVCAKRFSSKSPLKLHMMIHTGEVPFSCSVCARKFRCKRDMVLHMRIHTDEKPFACSVCGKSFSRKNYMTKHMISHMDEKPFTCSLCPNRFNCKASVIVHMRTHTGEKPYSCITCDAKFTYRYQVSRHKCKAFNFNSGFSES